MEYVRNISLIETISRIALYGTVPIVLVILFIMIAREKAPKDNHHHDHSH